MIHHAETVTKGQWVVTAIAVHTRHGSVSIISWPRGDDLNTTYRLRGSLKTGGQNG